MIPWQALATLAAPFLGAFWYFATKVAKFEAQLETLVGSHVETKERIEKLEERLFQ